jgi:hypothetical protein
MTFAPAVAAAALLATAGVHATVSPLPATPDGQVRVAIAGVTAPALSVRLRGGLASGGKWFGWVALQSSGPSSWSTVLRAPGYLGVYPVEIRTGGVAQTTDAAVEILPRGFAGQPGFATPEQVVEWWTRISPAGAAVTSVTTWHTGFFTHRDPELNRLLAVRFTLLRPWPVLHLKPGPHRIFLSVARLHPDGIWRLLETTTAP